MKHKSIFCLELVVALLLAVLAAAEPPQQAHDNQGRPITVLAPGRAHSVAYTDSAVQSAALGSSVVRLACTSDCYYAVGADPTATSASHYLPAAMPYDIRTTVGHKISFVRVSVSGTAYLTEWQ